MSIRSSLLAFALLLPTLASGQQLSITPANLPDASVGSNYYQEFQSGGGVPPYAWSISGKLPPGITFDSPSATLSGIPSAAGDYRFDLILGDSARHRTVRRYVLHITSGTIAVVWTRPPEVTNGGIFGEVELSNGGREVFDLTLIIVAVNETGRATALGYQHFSFSPGKQRVPFGTTLPRGTYVVHADAVGEIARTQTIRRTRVQSRPLLVP